MRYRVLLAYSSFFMKRFKKTAPEGIRTAVVDIQLALGDGPLPRRDR